MMSGNYEQKFFDTLRRVFIGAEVSGKGGHINLMRLKSDYYKCMEPVIHNEIQKILSKHPNFREELFDKLYTFFSRYISESGSIHFCATNRFPYETYIKFFPSKNSATKLFWVTKDCYYVKTDIIYKDMEIEIDNFVFKFDTSKLKQKKSNEKIQIVYELKDVTNFEVEGETKTQISFDVVASERGRVTKIDTLLEILKKHFKVKIDENVLKKAFYLFEKQTEVDFFIHKFAKKFLKDELNAWYLNYLLEGSSAWSQERLDEIYSLKELAKKIINFVGQFEDELVKIWNKPKFVKNSGYVITLNRFKDVNLIKKVLFHPGMKQQIEEWKKLGILQDESFENYLSWFGDSFDSIESIPKEYKTLPIDTKYFKDLELEIIGQFESLDKALDGWLVKSDNYQALNCMKKKFANKVQCIYIDPPFNTGLQFIYEDEYKDSTWLTMIHNRLEFVDRFLKKTGIFWLHLDNNSDYLAETLLKNTMKTFECVDKIILKLTVKGEDKEGEWLGYRSLGKRLTKSYETIFCCYNDAQNCLLNVPFISKTEATAKLDCNGRLDWLCSTTQESVAQQIKGSGLRLFLEKYNENGELEKIEITDKNHLNFEKVNDIWYNIRSFIASFVANSESYRFLSQKPEHLLSRIIQMSTKPGDLVMDFYGGSGTTAAVAQKLKRKWICVEMGDHFHEFYYDGEEEKIGILGRLKIVLYGDQEYRKTLNREHYSVLSRDINWPGGGFFKYYELEQYEETLSKCKYEKFSADLTKIPNPFDCYIFLGDPKLVYVADLDVENQKIVVNLEKLYENIDLAETFSLLWGKPIKKILEDKVIFEDGVEANIKDVDFRDVKPLIYFC